MRDCYWQELEACLMIAVSSFRALKNCSPEILKNQLRARESWESEFSHIVYFGEPESALDGPNVTFVQNVGEFPRIKDMAMFAGMLNDWACLINADIVLSPGLPLVKSEMIKRGHLCAISRRFEFQDDDIRSGRLVDQGLDCFLATPSVWKLAAQMIPKQFRISNILFDTWLIGFFASHYYQWFADFTECRMVFHAAHGDRKRLFEMDKRQGQEQFASVRWPMFANRIRIKSIADLTGTQQKHFS